MAEWYGNRHDERYIYRRVAWDNWQEHEAYGFITSGSLELAADSDLKVSGSFSFEGLEAPNTDDLVRIYYAFTDDAGEAVETPLATLFWTYSQSNFYALADDMKVSGDLEGLSVLAVLRDDLVGWPVTINKNANVIYEAQKIIKDHGLNVAYTPSIRVLSADHTFDAGTSYLEIVNWLCQTAGYTDAFPDPMGTVQLQPFADAELRTDALVFANDDQSIMYPDVADENSMADACNVVRLLYNTDTACIAAWARNVSGSAASLDVRGGREKTLFYEVGELDPDANPLDALTDMAETLLRQESCTVEYVTYAHAYVPMQLYDPLQIDYSDMSWRGNVDRMSIDFTPGIKTSTRVARVLYDEIAVEKSGEVLR